MRTRDKDKVIKTLKGAHALLKKRGVWTKRAYARNKNGARISLASADAVQFCLVGALERQNATERIIDLAGWEIYDAIDAGKAARFGKYEWLGEVVAWNDTKTRSRRQVLGVLTHTIRRLEKEKAGK